MDFPVGQFFRVTPSNRASLNSDSYPNLRAVTRGRHTTGLDTQKGMFFFAEVSGSDALKRRPAFIFDSNNLQRANDLNPWIDVIQEDRGYALYHGDNRSPGMGPLTSRGNRHFMEVAPQYSEAALRPFAPPVLLFEHAGSSPTKGLRRFSGFGIPVDIRIQTQASRSGHFSNLAIELALFGLESESELFPWSWIDDRRDQHLDIAEANRRAPRSWRVWIQGGDSAIGKIRRNVLRSRIVRPLEQRRLTSQERAILDTVYDFYTSHPHGFEALASLISLRVLGSSCRRGWVTRRAGDGGIDFVHELRVGAGFASASLVVLGQAKLRPPDGTVSGEDLARVVARLRRGWLGAFVTTGVYSDQAQMELLADEYPIVLINGRIVAQELQKEVSETGFTLEAILLRETEWYEANLSPLPAEQVISAPRSGTPLWPVGLSNGS